MRPFRIEDEGSDHPPRVAEPTLSELFEDPLIRVLMASDGVDPGWFWKFLMKAAKRQARGPKERPWLEQHM